MKFACVIFLSLGILSFVVVGVVFRKVLDAEVVNAECECCSAGGMFPESGGLGHGLVAKSFEFSDNLVKGDDACFF